jgi:hypothetical protein
MTKERIINESKNYLISVHDTLRRAFRNATFEEKVFIDSVLESLEQDVKQLEILEETMEVSKGKKDKKLEMINEE